MRQPIHARFHRSRVCGNWPRAALAIAYGKNGLGRFVPSACFFTAFQKKDKENNPSPSPAIVTATPTRHPTPSKLRGRVGQGLKPVRSQRENLAGLYGLGTDLVGERLDDIKKKCKPYLVLPPFPLLERAPRAP